MIQHLCLIALINLFIYYRTLSFNYVSDDVVVAAKTEPIPTDIWLFKWVTRFPKLLKLCIWINNKIPVKIRHELSNRLWNLHKLWLQLWGHRYFNPKHAHILTLGLHILNCLLIYILLRNTPIAFTTALLFSINPVNMQGGSVWLSGKGYSMATTATLIMFIIPILAPLLYFAAPYLAPSAFFSPMAFLGTKFWFWIFLIPIFMKWGAMGKIIHNKVYNQPNKTVNTEMTIIKPRKIIPFIKTFGYYFILCIFPFKMGLYHKFLYGFGTNQTDNKKGYKLTWSFWIGLLIMLWILAHIIYFHNLASWGLWWFCVNIAMWSNAKTIQQQVAERYLYLPNIGMSIFVAFALQNHITLLAMLMTAYLVRLWYIMPSYTSDYWIVEYNTAEFKNLHYPWLIRGIKKYGIGDLKGAYHDFCEAHIHKPYDFKVLFNLSCATLMLGDFKNARHFFEEAKKFRYDEIEVDINPLFLALETEIKKAEEQAPTGKYCIDLANVRVVKVLAFFFLYGISNIGMK